ncbi:hypothetical protein Hanom_Chr17g01532401 [Helianthus anomalus]
MRYVYYQNREERWKPEVRYKVVELHKHNLHTLKTSRAQAHQHINAYSNQKLAKPNMHEDCNELHTLVEVSVLASN